MLHPSYADLMQVINSKVREGEDPIVSSRYSVVMAASKRARQLISGDEAYVPEDGKKPLSLAVEEIAYAQIRIIPEEEYEEEIERIKGSVERANERAAQEAASEEEKAQETEAGSEDE